MSDLSKPRKRGVRLAPEACEELQRALTARWASKASDRRLTRELRAELLGVSLPTANKILEGEDVDRASLVLAFQNVGLAWNDAFCERAPKDAPVVPEPEAESAPTLEAAPSAPASRARPLLLGTGLLALLLALAWGTFLLGQRQQVGWRDDWQRIYDGAWALYDHGEYAKARVQADRALALAEAGDSLEKAAGALHLLGDLEGARGRLPEARELYRRELAIRSMDGFGRRRGLDPEYGKPATCESLGDVETRLGDYPSAKTHLLASLEGYRRTKEPVGVALAQRDLGSLALGQRDYDAADDWLRQSLESIRGLSKPDIEADVRGRQALVLLARGQDHGARDLLSDCLAYWKDKGHPRWIALTEMQLGQAEARLGETQSARARIARSLDAFAKVGDEARVAEATALLRRLVAKGP